MKARWDISETAAQDRLHFFVGLAMFGRKGAVAGQDSVLGIHTSHTSHTTELATSGRKGASPPSATPHISAAHRAAHQQHAGRPVHARVGSTFGLDSKTIRGGGGFILADAKDENVAFQPTMARRLRWT